MIFHFFPQILVDSEKCVLFDHEFTKLFKKLEGSYVYISVARVETATI